MPSPASIQELAGRLASAGCLRAPHPPALGQGPYGSEHQAPAEADLNRALDILKHTSQRYQAVIIDEGQDFQESWLAVAEACPDDPDGGRLAVFYDDNPRAGSFGPATDLRGIPGASHSEP